MLQNIRKGHTINVNLLVNKCITENSWFKYQQQNRRRKNKIVCSLKLHISVVNCLQAMKWINIKSNKCSQINLSSITEFQQLVSSYWMVGCWKLDFSSATPSQLYEDNDIMSLLNSIGSHVNPFQTKWSFTQYLLI